MNPYEEQDVEILLCARCEDPLRMNEETGEPLCACDADDRPDAWNIPSFEQYEEYHNESE